MTKEIQGLMAEFGTRIEALIQTLLDERSSATLAAVQIALTGDDPKTGVRGPKEKFSAAYKARIVAEARMGKQREIGRREKLGQNTVNGWVKEATARTIKYPTPKQQAIVAAIDKVSGSERVAAAKKHGVSLSRFYDWKRALTGGRGALGKRPKHSNADRRREIVAKASAMAPGQREIYLASEGVAVGRYYKWVAWVKKNPA